MNVNFGIMAPPDFKFRGKREKNEGLAKRSLDTLQGIAEQMAGILKN